MSDEQLWGQMKEGHKEALSEIYKKEINFLIGYGCKICGNQDLVEDCIQELFVEIWKNRVNLTITDNIRRYLLVSLRRKVIKKSSTKIVEISENNSFQDSKDEADYNLIQNESTETRKSILQKAILNLSPRQREAVHLKFYEEMSYEEICKVMDINYQAARNMVSKAIKALSLVVSKREIDDS